MKLYDSVNQEDEFLLPVPNGQQTTDLRMAKSSHKVLLYVALVDGDNVLHPQNKKCADCSCPHRS